MFESFGYKHGIPGDADFVFDVSSLPNPYWDHSLRHLTGRDAPVIDYLAAFQSVRTMIDSIAEFLDLRIAEFEEANRSYLTIAIGCTGGQHRSVYIAEELAAHFRRRYPAGAHPARLAAEALTCDSARKLRISSGACARIGEPESDQLARVAALEKQVAEERRGARAAGACAHGAHSARMLRRQFRAVFARDLPQIARRGQHQRFDALRVRLLVETAEPLEIRMQLIHEQRIEHEAEHLAEGGLARVLGMPRPAAAASPTPITNRRLAPRWMAGLSGEVWRMAPSPKYC